MPCGCLVLSLSCASNSVLYFPARSKKERLAYTCYWFLRSSLLFDSLQRWRRDLRGAAYAVRLVCLRTSSPASARANFLFQNRKLSPRIHIYFDFDCYICAQHGNNNDNVVISNGDRAAE